jgi:hypothetical protein
MLTALIITSPGWSCLFEPQVQLFLVDSSAPFGSRRWGLSPFEALLHQAAGLISDAFFRSAAVRALLIRNPASERLSFSAASINFSRCSKGILIVKITDLEFVLFADIHNSFSSTVEHLSVYDRVFTTVLF